MKIKSCAGTPPPPPPFTNTSDDWAWDAYFLGTGEHPFYRIGTSTPYNGGWISKEEDKLRAATKAGAGPLSRNSEFYPLTPEWVPLSGLLPGDVILDKDNNPIVVDNARPVISGGPCIGFADRNWPIDFRDPLHPKKYRSDLADQQGMEAVHDFDGRQYDRFSLEAKAHFINLRNTLTKNQYIYGCPESGVYDRINRKWPANPALCDKLYKQAQPLIRKETVYNLMVEDNNTYMVEYNGITLWTTAGLAGQN